MPDVAAPAAPRIPRWFAVALALLTALLLVLGVIRSNRSTLRGDEVVTLFANRAHPGFADMIRSGAKGQVSPAPLYYVVTRAVDESRGRVDYLGLTPSGYFRLPSLLFTAALGAASAWLIALRLRRQENPVSPVAWFLVLCGVAVYWSQPKVFSFACIDRPYALWNGLWLLTLAVFLARPDARLAPAILLSLMATTAIPACFQIVAMAISYYAVRRLEQKPTLAIVRDATVIFMVPLLIGASYAIRSTSLESEGGILASDKISSLMKFWIVTNAHAWMASGFCLFLVFRFQRLRQYATPVVAFALLLIILPLIFSLATLKGFSNPSRYYIWTTTALPLALFLAALGWPHLKSWRPAAPSAVALAAGLVAAFSIATFFRAPARNDSRRLVCLEPGSSLHDHLLRERPKFFCFPDTMGKIEKDNLVILAEWIGVRYRNLPIGDFEIPIRDENGRLVSDPIVKPFGLSADWTRLRIPD
jgi:hypothetical protein